MVLIAIIVCTTYSPRVALKIEYKEWFWPISLQSSFTKLLDIYVQSTGQKCKNRKVVFTTQVSFPS